MKITYHQGASSQEPYYPGGSFDGNAPDAFGTVSFLTSSTGGSLSPTTNTDVALDLTFGPAANAVGFIESSPSEPYKTSACITDLQTGEKVEIHDCTYNPSTSLYTCANGYYTFQSGTTVGTYRIDGGCCPSSDKDPGFD
jgi:hypothetical protein